MTVAFMIEFFVTLCGWIDWCVVKVKLLFERYCDLSKFDYDLDH